MDYMQILGFMFITLLLVISPGPNGLLITKTVTRSGISAGFTNVAGFLFAFYLHGTLSILGISVLLTQSADAFFIVKLLGAIYLCWIGVKSLLAALKSKSITALEAEQSTTKSRSFLKFFTEGFLTNALNPKVSMFYLAAFPQFIPAGEHVTAYAFLLITLHSLINILWFSILIMLLSKLGTANKSHFFSRLLKSFTGVVFIGFGLKLLTLESK